jgi:hypothetical protein
MVVVVDNAGRRWKLDTSYTVCIDTIRTTIVIVNTVILLNNTIDFIVFVLFFLGGGRKI